MPRATTVRTTKPRAKDTLVATDIPGVWRNRQGVQCDERGIALSFASVKEADDDRWNDVIGGPPESPAQLLYAVAMDPRMPLSERFAAAKQAAPYYDMRMPIRIDQSVKTPGSIDMDKLAKMKKADRELLLKLLKLAGADLG